MSTSSWRLKRTVQCKACPWLKSTRPNEIPNGYSEEKHRALSCTIARPGDIGIAGPQRAMACHETQEEESWVVLFATPVSSNCRVAIGTKDCQSIQRVGARDDGLHRTKSAALGAMGAAVRVQVMHFQERRETLATAATGTAQQGENLDPGVVAVLPLSLSFEEAVSLVLPGEAFPHSDIGPSAVGATGLLDAGFGVVGARQFASALLASGCPSASTFRVGAEFLKQFQKAAARALFHRVIIQPTPCIGWLANQIGPGNNIGLRMYMRSCANGAAIRLRGEQHETFEETLP